MSGSWRYRVIRDRDGWHRITEAHTLETGFAWSADPVSAGSNTLDGLREDLQRMLDATNHPVLLEADLEREACGE